MIQKEQVILVDEKDNPVGFLEKMEAHKKALLHRAVSVFIVNSKGEWLIQQRAISKYHSGGLWSNAACSHPRPDESNREAAERRLFEEMGLHAKLKELFQFIYKAKLDHELSEHELDHVFVGISEDTPELNPTEVMDWQSIEPTELLEDMKAQPEKYTVWFRLIAEKVMDQINSSSTNLY